MAICEVPMKQKVSVIQLQLQGCHVFMTYAELHMDQAMNTRFMKDLPKFQV